MKTETAKTMFKEMSYYEMVLTRLCESMTPEFYQLHKERLNELAFTINAFKQDKEITHGHRISTNL